MSKTRSNPLVRAAHFTWRLYRRSGVFYADGRSKAYALGRHSLNTRDEKLANDRLTELDEAVAVELELAPAPEPTLPSPQTLSLVEGRRLYESHIARPPVTGGVQGSTKKSYRCIFDKFVPWCQSRSIRHWKQLTPELLTAYASYLLKGGSRDRAFAEKTIVNHLTVIKQATKWLIASGHFPDMTPIALPLRKATSQRAYCWRPEEVATMVDYCNQHAELFWLGSVVIGLECTGLRISELASLRWADLDLERQCLSLTNKGAGGGEASADRTLKSVGSVREFPIHPDFMDILQRLAVVDRLCSMAREAGG